MTLQINNPNVLDLSEWQKVINEVNNLSNRIDAITTRYGAGSADTALWTATDFSKEFNLGTQRIIFGKKKVDTTDTTIKTGNFYHDYVDFDESPGVTVFTAKPIITATLQFGASSPVPNKNTNAIVSLYNVSKDGFSYRISNPPAATSDWNGYFYVNYIAIGPQ
jgi:hypothetical protein